MNVNEELCKQFLELQKRVNDLEKENRYLRDVLDSHDLKECSVCSEWTYSAHISDRVCLGCWQDSEELRRSDEEDYKSYRSKCTPIILKGN